MPTKQVDRSKRAATMNIQRKETTKSGTYFHLPLHSVWLSTRLASSSFHEKPRTNWNADQWLLRETVEYLDNSQQRRQKSSLRESTDTPRTGRGKFQHVCLAQSVLSKTKLTNTLFFPSLSYANGNESSTFVRKSIRVDVKLRCFFSIEMLWTK